ncbi:MAG: M6 family metalloprotease domain-containing protein, partial [Planctomycetota bacterium]
ALAPTGSLRDVYLENSYGAMELNSTIAPWATVSNSEQYYANGASGDQTLHQALIEALNAADATIDFSQFDQDGDGYIDSITFLHSGYGAEWGGTDTDGTHYSDRIWSHRWVLWDTNGDGNYTPLDQEWTSNEGVKVWDYHISPALWGTSGSNIGHVGVIAHETGHFFGLPDLYDTNGGGEGIGSYGLMANSWGFDGSQLYPPHMSPWSKDQLGWIAPTVLSAPGSYALQAAEDVSEFYRIDQGFPSGEYLLIENRQPLGFDGDMPQGGLAIWHIDEQANDIDEGYPGLLVQGTPWPQNGRHYRVALLQADGAYNLERGQNRGGSGDVWHAGAVDEINGNTLPSTDAYQNGIVLETGNRIYNISISGNTMFFDYDDGITPQDPPAAPSGLLATVDGAQVDLVWNDNADNEDGYLVFRDDVEIDSLPANSTAYSDGAVPAGWHDYFVRAYNSAESIPPADSNIETVEVILPPIACASDESTGFGTVTGSYVDTCEETGEETITETESKGRNKTSRMDHTWQVDGVAGGALVMLHVDAHAPANAEQDDFEFDVSTDGGASYQAAFTLANGADEVRIVELPLGTSGTVLVRVRDSNRGKGKVALNSVSVRQIYIESSSELILTAPQNLVAAPLSDSEIELTWDDGAGETGYNVEEWLDPAWVGVGVPLAPDSTSLVIGGLAADSSHTYRVCGFDGTS